VAHLYSRALGSLYVASYDSQGYSAGILTRLHTGLTILQSDPKIMSRAEAETEAQAQPRAEAEVRLQMTARLGVEPNVGLATRY
jgi:hypothetical protein